jgi:plasmid maintenance system antidote protein VapI
MRLKNNIFAAAVDEMKRRGIIKYQKDLAQKMDVSEDTITRILKDRTEVTEDVITKLQTASGCLFNLQWLRGESNIMLAEDVQKQTIANPSAQESAPIDMDFFHQALKINADIIADLRRNVEYFQQLVLDKDSLIQEHNEQIVALNIDKAKLATELEHLRTTLDAVRNNFDAKVTELEKRDQIIKTLQSVIDRESRGDYRIPTGVAEPPAAYNNDKK